MKRIQTLSVCLAFLLHFSSSLAAPIRAEWQPQFQSVYKSLEDNLHPPSEFVPYYHAQPAPKFPDIYLWDSAFIALIWKYHDAERAKDVLRSVLYNQEENGKVPLHVGFWGHSKLTQPPLLSFATADIAEYTQDLSFARELYPKLRSYHEWLWRERRLPNGLFFWQHPYESGIDNSPRFSNRDESQLADTKKISAIDFSSYAAIDAQSLLRIATLLVNRTNDELERSALEADIARYNSQNEEISRLVRKSLWDESSGYFFDLDGANNFLRVPTIASFFPLLAGIPNEHQWQKMREHLVSAQEFNTPMPLPTVARNSSYFEKDCWRGPIWINTAYLVVQGVKKYGDKELANNYAYRITDSVYRVAENTGEFVEFYDPERLDFQELSRKRGLGPFGLSITGNLWEDMEYLVGKRIFLGDKPVNHFIGWTGLVNNLALELE